MVFFRISPTPQVFTSVSTLVSIWTYSRTSCLFHFTTWMNDWGSCKFSSLFNHKDWLIQFCVHLGGEVGSCIQAENRYLAVLLDKVEERFFLWFLDLQILGNVSTGSGSVILASLERLVLFGHMRMRSLGETWVVLVSSFRLSQTLQYLFLKNAGIISFGRSTVAELCYSLPHICCIQWCVKDGMGCSLAGTTSGVWIDDEADLYLIILKRRTVLALHAFQECLIWETVALMSNGVVAVA